MKRYDINTSHIVRLNEVELDGDKYEIRYKDECIHLPLKQFELLFELAKHPNQIFSREQLIEKIWGMDYDGFDRTVDVHIKRIRENIDIYTSTRQEIIKDLIYLQEHQKELKAELNITFKEFLESIGTSKTDFYRQIGNYKFLIEHFDLTKQTTEGEVMHLYFEEKNSLCVDQKPQYKHSYKRKTSPFFFFF